MQILDYVGKGVLNALNTLNTSTVNRSEGIISKRNDNNTAVSDSSSSSASCYNTINTHTITGDQSSQYNASVHGRSAHPMVNIPLTPNTLKQLTTSSASTGNATTVISTHSTTQEIERLRKRFNASFQEAIIDPNSIQKGAQAHLVENIDNVNRNTSTSINSNDNSNRKINLDNNSIAAICTNIKIEDTSSESQEVISNTTGTEKTFTPAETLATEVTNTTLSNAVGTSANSSHPSKTESQIAVRSLAKSASSINNPVQNAAEPKRKKKRKYPILTSRKGKKKSASTATKIAVTPSKKQNGLREVKELYNDLQRNIQLSNLVDSIVNPGQKNEGRRLRRGTIDLERTLTQGISSSSIENMNCPTKPTPSLKKVLIFAFYSKK